MVRGNRLGFNIIQQLKGIITMAMKAAKPVKTLHLNADTDTGGGLSIEQQNAIDMLIQGKRDRETAEAGVHRA